MWDVAFRACLRNPEAYIGANQEDTFRLMAQCADDYMDMKGWR
jgi:hypothetical protein